MDNRIELAKFACEIVADLMKWGGTLYEISKYGGTYAMNPDRVAHIVSNSPESDVVFVPMYCTFGDYCGGLVERANLEYLTDEFHDCEWLNSVSFSYGGRQVQINVVDLAEGRLAGDSEMAERFAEFLVELERLSSYPLLDEDLHSELEMEAQNSAICECADDLINSVSGELSAFEHDRIGTDEIRQICEDVMQEACENAGVIYHEADGGALYVNPDDHASDALEAVRERLAETAPQLWIELSGNIGSEPSISDFDAWRECVAERLANVEMFEGWEIDVDGPKAGESDSVRVTRIGPYDVDEVKRIVHEAIQAAWEHDFPNA